MRERRNRSRAYPRLLRLLLWAGGVLKSIPILGSLALSCKEKFEWMCWKVRVEMRSLELGFRVDQMYWVDPKDIHYCTPLEWNPFKHQGEVRSGDWDKTDIEFEQLDVFCAMKDRYVGKKEWQDATFYRRIISRINSGEVLWGCRSQREFDLRCERLDRIFEETRTNGYRSQEELNGGKSKMSLKNIDEVSINISRDGKMLFNNSAHRLAIAKLLDIKRIPVGVIVRHPNSIGLEIPGLTTTARNGAANG